MRTTEQINELAAALAAAQGMMGGALKDSQNPAHNNKYADLASVWEACRQPLAKNGLAVIQTAGSVNIKERKHVDVKKWDKYKAKEYTVTEDWIDATITITTRLVHTSGQFIEEDLEMIINKADPQGIGSAITYARRYSLAAMVGVYQEDDDGNGAKGLDPNHPIEQQPEPKHDLKPAPQQPAAQPAQGQTSTTELFKEIIKLKTALEMSDDGLKKEIKEVLGVDRLNGQPPQQFQKLIDHLAAKTPAPAAEPVATQEKTTQGTLPEFPV